MQFRRWKVCNNRFACAAKWYGISIDFVCGRSTEHWFSTREHTDLFDCCCCCVAPGNKHINHNTPLVVLATITSNTLSINLVIQCKWWCWWREQCTGEEQKFLFYVHDEFLFIFIFCSSIDDHKTCSIQYHNNKPHSNQLEPQIIDSFISIKSNQTRKIER